MTTQKTRSVKKKPVRKSPRKGNKKQGFLRRNAMLLIIAGIVVAVAMAICAFIAFRPYPGKDSRIDIPEGASRDAVRDSLESQLGEPYASRVFMLWNLTGGRPETARGVYSVTHGQPAFITAWRLRGGRQTPVRLTFNNVRTMDQLAARIAAQMQFTEADFMNACRKILPPAGFKPEEFPAAFVPDSYEFYGSASAETVVKRLLDYRNRFWDNRRTADARRLGLTPVEAATLASIVEEESAKADERPVIARLYLNRLDRDMPLQADPTVKFSLGDFALRRITEEHLRADSPYNTYRHRGLPPGPIRISSKEGIDAVLQAPDHEFIYMCAKEDFSGYHNFAANYSEHMENARRYQAELNKRGIR